MIRGVEMKRFYSICNKQLNEIRVNWSDRESIGLSRGELSELMVLSVKTFQAWGIGRNKPNGSSFRLLQILQFSRNEVID